jgi:hypothetical protein
MNFVMHSCGFHEDGTNLHQIYAWYDSFYLEKNYRNRYTFSNKYILNVNEVMDFTSISHTELTFFPQPHALIRSRSETTRSLGRAPCLYVCRPAATAVERENAFFLTLYFFSFFSQWLRDKTCVPFAPGFRFRRHRKTAVGRIGVVLIIYTGYCLFFAMKMSLIEKKFNRSCCIENISSSTQSRKTSVPRCRGSSDFWWRVRAIFVHL